MKLTFETPYTPNFIRTKQGLINLEFLTNEELDEFVVLFHTELLNKWKKKNDKK